MKIPVSEFDGLSIEMEDRLQALVGPAGLWKARRDMQIQLLNEIEFGSDCKFLDLGCGSLRLGIPLISYLKPGKYTGVDIDSDCVTAANEMIEHFELKQKDPRIIQSETFGNNELGGVSKYDIIWLFQVFIHLTDDKVKLAMNSVKNLLEDNGSTYASVWIKDDLDSIETYGKWRYFPAVHAPLSYYQECACDSGLQLESLGVIDESGKLITIRNRSARLLHLVKMSHSSRN